MMLLLMRRFPDVIPRNGVECNLFVFTLVDRFILLSINEH